MGYLYIMSNPSFKDNLLKIGKTDHDPNERKKHLETTGVPDSFFLEYCVRLDDHHELERKIHRELSSSRTNRSREFFNITVPQAIFVVRKILMGKDYKEYVFYRDPKEIEKETRQQEKKEAVERFLTSTKNSMHEIVDQERKKMKDQYDKWGVWSLSALIFIIATLPVFSFSDYAVLFYIAHAVATFWVYNDKINKHESKVNKIFYSFPKRIDTEIDSIEKSLMNDPHWRTNMQKCKDRAERTIRAHIMLKSTRKSY